MIELGKRCTIVEIEPVVLSRVFGEDIGRHFHELLTARGVEIASGETVAAFEGDERISTVLTESGLSIDCDAVVIGAGVRPDTMLAGRAGLEVGNGIICDSGLETSLGGVFAAGDCCSYESELHRGARVRFEHWDVALQQGRHAARGMLGDKRPYAVVPYFFSDLSDWESLEYVGGASDWDEVLRRGDPGGGEFSAWYVESGRLVAALSVGRSEDLPEARRLIAGGGATRRRQGDHRRPGCRPRGNRLANLSIPSGTPRRAAMRAGVIGNTPLSGRGIQGSSPWPAASPRPAIGRGTSAGPLISLK